MSASKCNGNMWPKILLGIVGLSVGVWILVSSLGALAKWKWEAYAASLRAKGQPLTFAEIEARRAVIPDDQNSAKVIEGLANDLKGIESGAKPDVLFFGTGPQGSDFFEGFYPRRIQASRPFLELRKAMLIKLRGIAHKPTGHFALDIKRSSDGIAPPDLSRLRNAGKLVLLDHVFQLLDDDVAAAVDNTCLLCRLSGTVHDEPTLISRLVQIALETQAAQSVENILRVTQVDDASLTILGDELKSLRKNGTMRWALLGERAYFVATCESVISDSTFWQSWSSDSNRPSIRKLPDFVLRSNQITGAKMLSRLIEIDNDSMALRAEAERIEEEISNLSWTQIIIKILFPSNYRAVTLNMKLEAKLDCTVAALAAERFRLAGGGLPSTLEELVPRYLSAVPVDPFDGKSLRLAKTGEGIVIYSVDENGVDDGGFVALPPQEKKLKRAPDVGFRLNDVDHRGVLLVDDPPKDDE